MLGGRGAKGSVRDRVISMLYRFRYNKKKLKQEQYTVAKKEEQKAYLNKLNEFKETQDINVLDLKDKEQLDKVEYNVEFKVKGKEVSFSGDRNQKDEETIQVKQDSNLEIELNNIEFRNTGFEDTVEVKKEVKKVTSEKVILEEVNDFIEKSIENIFEIEKEVEIIKKESKEKNKDLEQTELQYKKLKEKITKLKKQYDTIKEKYDLSEFCILESIKLIDNIDDYKSIASLSEIEMMLNVCKKEIKQIEKVEVVFEENKKTGIDLDNTKGEQKNIKIKFKKSKEKIDKYNQFEENIAYELKVQQEIINKMYNDASKFEKNIRKDFEYSGYGRIFSSMLKIMGGVLTLPLTGKSLFGVSLGATAINKNLKILNKGLDRKEKIVVDYKYEDFSNKISQVNDKLEYTNLVLNDSLNEIKKLKEKFSNIFSEYDNILPEYLSTLKKINELETKLKEQSKRLLNMDKKLEDTKERNKQKMKKVCK